MTNWLDRVHRRLVGWSHDKQEKVIHSPQSHANFFWKTIERI